MSGASGWGIPSRAGLGVSRLGKESGVRRGAFSGQGRDITTQGTEPLLDAPARGRQCVQWCPALVAGLGLTVKPSGYSLLMIKVSLPLASEREDQLCAQPPKPIPSSQLHTSQCLKCCGHRTTPRRSPQGIRLSSPRWRCLCHPSCSQAAAQTERRKELNWTLPGFPGAWAGAPEAQQLGAGDGPGAGATRGKHQWRQVVWSGLEQWLPHGASG